MAEALEFPKDLWRYLCGPASFLRGQDLASLAGLKKSLKYLGIGISGTIAFSAVNLKFTSLADDAATREALTRKSPVTVAVVLGGLLFALLAHATIAVTGASLGWRRSYAAFAFTLGFVWLIMALVLIFGGWGLQLAIGYPAVALPPFDVATDAHIERTTGNLLWVAFFVTVYLWAIGYALYCYACAVWVAQQPAKWRLGAAVIVPLAVLFVFQEPIARFCLLISDKLGPLVEWVEGLL